MAWHPNWHRGSWAGARVDLALLSDIEEIEEWKDITEETFRDLWKAQSMDSILNQDCDCSLRDIYRRMDKEEKENKDQKGKEDPLHEGYV
jgi:hypothetical protein